MKNIELYEKRIKEADEHLAWFYLEIALSVYTPAEITEKKNWWREDRDWCQKELDNISAEVDILSGQNDLSGQNELMADEEFDIGNPACNRRYEFQCQACDKRFVHQSGDDFCMFGEDMESIIVCTDWRE